MPDRKHHGTASLMNAGKVAFGSREGWDQSMKCRRCAESGSRRQRAWGTYFASLLGQIRCRVAYSMRRSKAGSIIKSRALMALTTWPIIGSETGSTVMTNDDWLSSL